MTINVIFLQQQEPIESTMDETANNRSNIVCNAKETTAEEGRLISKAIFNTPNTGNPGKNYLEYIDTYDMMCYEAEFLNQLTLI